MKAQPDIGNTTTNTDCWRVEYSGFTVLPSHCLNPVNTVCITMIITRLVFNGSLWSLDYFIFVYGKIISLNVYFGCISLVWFFVMGIHLTASDLVNPLCLVKTQSCLICHWEGSIVSILYTIMYYTFRPHEGASVLSSEQSLEWQPRLPWAITSFVDVKGSELQDNLNIYTIPYYYGTKMNSKQGSHLRRMLVMLHTSGVMLVCITYWYWARHFTSL